MRIIGFAAALLFTVPGHAADPNGYVAKYECRGGNANCNVDVVSLGNRACDQVVSVSTPWAAINWSKNTICLEAGDHSGKGTLTIPPNTNGTPSNYKVLRYVRSNDTNDEPWRQTAQAKVEKLIVDQSDYWLIHRLTFPSTAHRVEVRVAVSATVANDTKNVIVNRVLIEGSMWAGVPHWAFSEICVTNNYDMITVQNSVIRGFYGAPNLVEAVALDLQCGKNLHAVNNEIYDWSSHPIQTGNNHGPTLVGIVVENNDLYHSPLMYTNGGQRMRAEAPLQIKNSGTVLSPTQIMQNRIFGSRWTDLSTCCNGQDGTGLSVNLPFGGSFKYILIQNNTIFDNQNGVAWYPVGSKNMSVIGNIFARQRQYLPSKSSHAAVVEMTEGELYANTFIDNAQYGMSFGGGQNNLDIRCNALISGGAREGGTPPATVTAASNAFYGTPSWSFNSTGQDVIRPMKTRANNTGYAVDDIVRTGTGDACNDATDTECFLYKVVIAGSSAGAMPVYCVSLGCTMQDGSVQLQAVRGPYTFYRKLLTGPEAYTLPYARVHVNAADASACPATYSARDGVGITD